MTNPIDVDIITRLQIERTTDWHNTPPALTADPQYQAVEENHLNNFLLWHEEDTARRDDLGAEHVMAAKRKIDGYNQQRNNCMERIDAWFIQHLEPKIEGCPFNSENPGMIVDRLSILALKAYHMEIQTHRETVTEEHRQTCLNKLAVIQAQHSHLATCLKELIEDVKSGTRSFRAYHQFKMYNDPSLNPQLYTQSDND